MRILLTGGGSGGHVYPLIAVYRKIVQISKYQGIDADCLFMGPDSFSVSVFRKEKVRSKMVLAGKLRRYFSVLNIMDIFKIPIGFVQVFWQLFWFMPDAIFAKGGYGSVLPVFVGWIFRIPIIINESDAAPGLANRILGRFAKMIIVSFQETQQIFPSHKTAFVGNPIREELFKEIPADAREILGIKSNRPLILILGGSQGSEEINDVVLLSLPELMLKYEIIHQCGAGRIEKMKKGDLVQVRDFESRHLFHIFETLDEKQMSSAYHLADLIIS